MSFDAAYLPLLRELGDLKRIRSAERDGSIAERLFARGWAALAAGEAPVAVMRRTVAAALAAVRIGDLDRATLAELGLSDAEARAVLERAFDEVAVLLDPALAADQSPEHLRRHLEESNIETRPLWKPLHLQPAFADAPAYGGAVAEGLYARGLCLPSGNGMRPADLDRVVDAILRF